MEIRYFKNSSFKIITITLLHHSTTIQELNIKLKQRILRVINPNYAKRKCFRRVGIKIEIH